MFPRLCSPPPPTPSWSWVTGSRVSAKSHPHRSTRTRELQCALVAISLYLRQKASFAALWEHFFYSHEASFWYQVCFRSSAVVNLHFSCPKSASATWNCLQLEFSVNDRFKAGFHLKAVFTSLNVAFVPISRSRFKQCQIPPLRTFTTALRFCENFWVIFGHFVNGIFFLKG